LPSTCLHHSIAMLSKLSGPCGAARTSEWKSTFSSLPCTGSSGSLVPIDWAMNACSGVSLSVAGSVIWSIAAPSSVEWRGTVSNVSSVGA